ncbi:hypothetical protein C8R43DRAFT_1118725 [Mycena crocata]|nr:hypothetical protein C8R43DRAFT_1118725 [Mycena crocata]
MPPNVAKALQTVSLVGQNKTAVIVGGTLGIGAAIARLLSKLGCSRIIIFGRNAKRAAAVLEVLKTIAPAESKVNVEFVKGDLSDSNGMRDAASALQAAAGDAGIDYLIMTQSGTPTGTIVDNADGYDIPFAIQAVSRFALAYLLTTRGALAPNAAVMSVCNQGQSLDDLTVDDLSLRHRSSKRSHVKAWMEESARDSSVLDAFHEELNLRYPQYRYFHLYPGLVKTEEFDMNLFPALARLPLWVALKLIGTTPDEYAVLPVYVLVAPEAERELGPGRYFGRTLNPGRLGNWAQDPTNRAALWEKLLEMIGAQAVS